MRSSAHPGRRWVTSAGRELDGFGEGLSAAVAEEPGVVVGVVGPDSDGLAGLELLTGGGESPPEQPLMAITSATEAVARMLRRRRLKIMSLR